MKDESGYKSFFGKLRMNEIEYNGSHDSVWWIIRREAKVNWM